MRAKTIKGLVVLALAGLALAAAKKGGEAALYAEQFIQFEYEPGYMAGTFERLGLEVAYQAYQGGEHQADDASYALVYFDPSEVSPLRYADELTP